MNSKLKNGTEETPEQRIIRKTKRYMDIGKTGGYAPVIGFLLTVIEEYKEMAHAVRTPF
jgi:hypothetical protein